MRIASLTIYNESRYQLNKTLSSLTDANRTVSTGKRVGTASDDPTAAGRILQMESSLSHLDQMARNIDTGKLWLETQESTLNSMLESLLDAKDTALAMSNDTCNEQDRATAADTAHQLLLTLVDLANTRVDGQYLFSGTKTDTPSYALNDSENPAQVVYQGNAAAFTIQIRQSATLSVGYPGSSVFGSTESGEDVFSLLIRMEDALKNNETGELGTIIEALDSHYNRIVETVSGIGTKAARLDMTENVLADLTVNLTEGKSRLEDADFIEAVTLLTERQTAYEASLSAYSKIMSLSLVDYI